MQTDTPAPLPQMGKKRLPRHRLVDPAGLVLDAQPLHHKRISAKYHTNRSWLIPCGRFFYGASDYTTRA